MEMSNRVTLEQMENMDLVDLVLLPTEHIALLQEDIEEAKRTLKVREAKLDRVKLILFAERGKAELAKKSKETGEATFALDDEFKVNFDIPKKVEWDQGLLAKAVETVESWGENPREYVSFKIEVSETKYGAWPSTIKKVFDPARTVSAGKQSVTLLRKDAPKKGRA